LLWIRIMLLAGCAGHLLAQEYGGPAILSRGDVPLSNAPASMAFRPYVGISGFYDYGLLPVSVNSSGQVPVRDSFGEELDLGLNGYHAWEGTRLSLDYRGDFRNNTLSYYDSSDHFLALSLAHQLRKHVTFSVHTQAGTYAENYFLGGFGYLYSNYLQTPQNDIYDNRVIFAGTSGSLIFQKSARLSFSISGEGEVVRRRSTALYGDSIAGARGDVEYRVTRHTTMGVDYHFMHFDFTRGFGYSNIHSVGVNYSRQFTRHVQLSARIGGARIESESLVAVPINPAVAAIIGQSVGIQAAHRLSYAPDILSRLSYNAQRAAFGVVYNNTLSPGNGVYLTSRMQTARAFYSYTGIRYWNFGADGGYDQLRALTQTLGVYSSYGAGGGATRTLGKGFHAVLRFDVRHFNVAENFFLHNEYRAMLGLNWSPGEVPLKLW
jgi:hypothetical protein